MDELPDLPAVLHSWRIVRPFESLSDGGHEQRMGTRDDVHRLRLDIACTVHHELGDHGPFDARRKQGRRIRHLQAVGAAKAGRAVHLVRRVNG